MAVPAAEGETAEAASRGAGAWSAQAWGDQGAEWAGNTQGGAGGQASGAAGESLGQGHAPVDGSLCLCPEALDRLMPLHLRIDPEGRVAGCGPTLGKLFPDIILPGQSLFALFDLSRPQGVQGPGDLGLLAGARLKLVMKAPPRTSFKGLAVALDAGRGWLLNLSFGIGVPEAVREHRLTDADFAATDLAIEMLYLLEAKSAVLEELRRLNLRLHSAKAEAEAQALSDALTGLGNRRALEGTLAGLLAARMPFGLMQVDLDFFKQVNDSFGHAAGDHVLLEVARILKEETRASDTVARVGGDEFVVILPGLSRARVLDAIAARTLARIERPILFEGARCEVSASIGTILSAACPEGDAERLMCGADRATYASKRAGRGRVTHFSPELPEIREGG